MSTAIITQQEMEPIKARMSSLLDADTVQREVSFAMQAINGSAGLQKCSKESLQKAVFNIALTGLSLNPVTKLAYLIPRWSAGGMQAVLEPSYQGLIRLLTDTGSIRSIYAHPVYDGDEFEVQYGTTAELIHKPKFKSKTMTHVYAVATLSDGAKQFEVMTAEEVNEIRERSESYKAFTAGKVKSCTWESDYGEMARKTVIKRIFKYLPKSEVFNRAAEAIAIADSDYTISDRQADYLVQLIEGAGYDPESQRHMIARVYEGITKAEYERMVAEAKANTMDPILAGRNYSQTDISNHLKNMPE